MQNDNTKAAALICIDKSQLNTAPNALGSRPGTSLVISQRYGVATAQRIERKTYFIIINASIKLYTKQS